MSQVPHVCHAMLDATRSKASAHLRCVLGHALRAHTQVQALARTPVAWLVRQALSQTLVEALAELVASGVRQDATPMSQVSPRVCHAMLDATRSKASAHLRCVLGHALRAHTQVQVLARTPVAWLVRQAPSQTLVEALAELVASGVRQDATPMSQVSPRVCHAMPDATRSKASAHLRCVLGHALRAHTQVQALARTP
eukprot:COSAG01_NODE_7196_length_3308_cov_16.219071_5_plen_196_part_01